MASVVSMGFHPRAMASSLLAQEFPADVSRGFVVLINKNWSFGVW
jgi:hypothetical protein